MQLHEKNTGFCWQPAQGPFRLLSEAQARQYDVQGFFLLKDVFTADEICAVRDAIDPLEREYEQRLRDRHNGRLLIARAGEITFTAHLVTRVGLLREFSRHQVFRDLAQDTLGSDVRLYWDQAVYKKPGNPEEFPWHQDNGYTYIEPQQYLTCWVPLSDATLENGCPWVAPGVHRVGTLRHERTPLGMACQAFTDIAVAVPARVGDVVVFSSLTPHRTGPNRTSETRKSYILQYAPDGAAMHAPDGVIAANHPDRQYLLRDPI